MARATSSLPVPVSPCTSTETLDCARRSTARPISCIAELAATRPGISGAVTGVGGGSTPTSDSAITVLPILSRVPTGTTASLMRTSPTKVPLRLPQILDQDAVLAAQLQVVAAHRRIGQDQLVVGRGADRQPLAEVLGRA